MPNRNKRARDKDRFIFTTDLRLIKPYAEYHMCIENYISRFKPNDVILYIKNIGFALINHRDFCPIDILNDPYCLDYIYINENYRGKGHGRRLMNLILKHSQIIIHSLDVSLGFFEHLSKDLGLEKINRNIPFGDTFISTNLHINREPIVNKCIGGCGLVFSGYKRYVFGDCYPDFARYNIDIQLIKSNDCLRSKLNKQQPAIITQMSLNQIVQLTRKSIDYQYSLSEHILTQILKQMNNPFFNKHK